MTNPASAQNQEIDCLSPEAQRLAEARLAAKRAARAEAREIRMKELERQQKETNGYDGDVYGSQPLSRRSGRPSEHSGHLSSSSRASSRASSARASPVVEERPEKDFTEKGSRNLPSLSAATLASLGGTSTRRGSGDTSVSADTEASMREIKDSLAEVEEKYKKAMVSNAQLDNEKTNYMYQVDSLKDTLLGLEEQLAESRRQYEEKSKEFEREKHAHGLLRFQLAEMKAALQQREELLQKHGIILNSEVATNGETSDTLRSTGHRGPTRTTKEELSALQAPGDGPLGRATEVEVKSDTVDSVGKREILPNTAQEPHQEDPAQAGADTGVLPPGGSAQDQRPSDSGALALATVADATDEDQVQSPVLANMSILERTEQAGSGEVTSTPDAGAGASECLREPDGDVLGPEAERGGGDAMDPLNQSRESAETQKREKQDCGASVGEVSPEPQQEPAPAHISEVDEVNGPQGSVQPEPEGTVASRPPGGSVDTVSQDDRCVADVPREVDASTGCGLETELTSQGAEPGVAPVQSAGCGGCRDDGQAEGAGLTNEKPTQTEAQTSPSPAAATDRVWEATSPHTADAESKPLDAREPGEDSNDPQGEGLDSPQKKTKNKKKKNKKKKPPAPAETSKDAKRELPPQSPDLAEVEGEEPVRATDKRPGAGAPDEAAGGPTQNSVAGSGNNRDVPERADMEVDGKLHPEDGDTDTEAGKAIANGEPGLPGGDAAGASGSRAGAGGLEEGRGTDGDGAAPRRPPGDEDMPRSALRGGQRPPGDVDGGRQGVREVSESHSPEGDGVAPSGEAGGQSEKDKSKEDCTLS